MNVLHVLGAPGAVEENVVPVGGVEVFDAFELEAGSLDLLAECDQFGGGPEFVGIAGDCPRACLFRRWAGCARGWLRPAGSSRPGG